MVEQVKILISCLDDSVAVLSFITNDFHGIKREATDENVQKEINRLTLESPVKSWRKITDSDLIPDRTFRNAWKDSGSKLEVHMPKAREIHKDHLRQARGLKFIELDAEYMKADEENDTKKKKEIKDKKQALRDITNHPAIELAQTPEELKAFTIDSVL